MGFKAPRSCGETFIQVDFGLLKKLAGRYLGKSALSALFAQDEEKRWVGESTSSAESADKEKGLFEVHSATDRNNCNCADSAASAENQRVCTRADMPDVFKKPGVLPDHLKALFDEPEI